MRGSRAWLILAIASTSPNGKLSARMQNVSSRLVSAPRSKSGR
jgi:hypothetical protein